MPLFESKETQNQNVNTEIVDFLANIIGCYPEYSGYNYCFRLGEGTIISANSDLWKEGIAGLHFKSNVENVAQKIIDLASAKNGKYELISRERNKPLHEEEWIYGDNYGL